MILPNVNYYIATSCANLQSTWNWKKMYHIYKTGLIFILYESKEVGPNRNVGDDYKVTIYRTWTLTAFKCIYSQHHKLSRK